MTRERIKDIQEVIVPYFARQFKKWNYEGLGEEDAKEAEKDLNEVFDLETKALEQEPRWISVNERLPEESHAVLVHCPERKNIYCAFYVNKQWWIFGAFMEKLYEEVRAWMPLPQAYREVEE